jgi:hypothetical protein
MLHGAPFNFRGRSAAILAAFGVASAMALGGVVTTPTVAHADATSPKSPVSRLRPHLVGSSARGSVIALTPGTFSHETKEVGTWFRCPTKRNTRCTATEKKGHTYTVSGADPVGDYIRLDETATNASGTNTVRSNLIGPITPTTTPAPVAAPTTTPAPSAPVTAPTTTPAPSATVTAPTTTPAPSASPLAWAPPSMVSPQVINVQSGLDPDVLDLNVNEDYVLHLPSGGIHGTIEINGGHNVTLIGGSVTVPAAADQIDNGADDTDTAIYVKGATGVVHIEGLLINADPDVEYDGIDINAPQATVQVENVRMEDLYGSQTTEHADAIQTWGGVKSLDVDGLTADGDYQGLTISPALGSVGTADIRNVDLTDDARPAPLASLTVGGGIMIWLTTTTSCSSPTVLFQNVYLNNVSDRLNNAGTVWPSSTSALPCAGVLQGASVSWPDLPVTGSVTFGAPPNGSFVPSAMVGNHYVSPGY